METTKHPNLNPDENSTPTQDKNTQPTHVENTVEESNSETIEAQASVEETQAEATIDEVQEAEVPVSEATLPEEAISAETEASAEEIQPEKSESKAPEVESVEVTSAEITEDSVADIIAEDDSIEADEFDADLETYSREKLVSMMEDIVKNADVNDIKSRVALIKVAYLKATSKEHQDKLQEAASSEEAENFETIDPLEERFKAAFGIYRQNKNRFTEDLEKQKIENLEAKKKILEDLKTLINSDETLKKTYDEFKALQDKWKEIGMVPKSDANGLWQNYHFLIEKFFDKVKINKELKDLDLRKNLERKIELCEKAEELLIETSITKAFKRLQELHEEWKEIGPVAQDKRDEVWDRFKSATEKINDRRHEIFKSTQAEFEANYAAKVVLCEKAEQLISTEYTTLKEWQNSTQGVNELLKMWKSIGQAPNKVNNEIWNKFKGYLDQYFTNKKEFFGKIKDQHQNNYNLKVELCLQAESHKLSTDWKNSSRELVRLQEEWKKIGPVPRKHSEKIWKRFRSACDEFFNSKNEYFKNAHQSEAENLVRKQDIISKLTNFEYSENRQESLNQVKELQREWMETGHVPIKEKDRVQAEYKKAVNHIYDKLKVDSMEAGRNNYRARFDNLKDQPEATKIINRERSGLQTKIDALKEEILLWENNIGFFANSKQANLLKQEFENKIARAKTELTELEAKAKILRNVAKEQQ